jgi:hypothetical protein
MTLASSFLDASLQEFYLRSRLSLCFFSSFTMGLTTDLRQSDSVARIASVLAAVVEILAASSKYSRLKGVSRLPGSVADRVHVAAPSNRAAVLCRGILYTVEFVSPGAPNSNSASVSMWYSAVTHILQDAASNESGNVVPVAALTSLPRDEYAGVFPLIERSALVTAATTAAFIVALDTIEVVTKRCEAHRAAVGPVENRWFDKSMQVLCHAPSGAVSFCFEHTTVDGLLASNFVADVHDVIDGRPPWQPLHCSDAVATRKVASIIDGVVSAAVRRAIDLADYERSQREIVVVSVPYGFRDVDIQIAIFKGVSEATGTAMPTCESVSMSHVPNGRYATIFFTSLRDLENGMHRTKVKKCKVEGDPGPAVDPCFVTTSNGGRHRGLSFFGFTDTDRGVIGVAYLQRAEATVLHIKADGQYRSGAELLARALTRALEQRRQVSKF